MKLSKIIDTPSKFFDSIPQNVAENVEFRQNLHSQLVSDKEAQKVFCV